MSQYSNEDDSVEHEFQKSQTLRLGVPEWRVLLALAYQGPQSMYSIKKKNNISYPIVHQATLRLEKNGWVKIIRTELSKKHVTRKIYSLTGEGLLWFFSRVPRTIPAELIDSSIEDKTGSRERMEKVESTELEDLGTQESVYLHLLFDLDADSIIKANADLFPTVFENWSVFGKSEVAKSFSRVFPEAAFSTLLEYYHGYRGLRSRFCTLEKLFAYESYRTFLESTCRAYATLQPGPEVNSFARARSFNEMREAYLTEILTLYRQNPQARDILDQILSELEEASKQTLELLKIISTKRLSETA